jgi:YVTN family beta-propeller protein/probable HAF family extracellular repeat protein
MKSNRLYPARLAFLFAFLLLNLAVFGQNNFIQIDYPGSVVWTEVREINNSGEMAGRYIDTENVIHAFTLNSHTFTNIDVPGATQTAAWGINDYGDVVGRYFDPVANRDHGFLLHNGTYTIIDPPGTTETFALGINNQGQIVGYYNDSTGHTHGFLLSNGVYTTIDFPGSNLTEVLKTNNFGTQVGIYLDSSNVEHGFQLQNGTFTTIDVPGAVYTEVYGINNGGQIVGGYGTSDSSNEVGFELTNGNFQTINFAAAVGGMLVEDINDQEQLVGVYVDDSGIGRGFVTPSGPFVYVSNPADNNILVIDSASEFQLTQTQAGSVSGAIAASPDQKQVYATTNGNQVAVIDTTTNTVVNNVTVGNGAVSIAFTPDGSYAYVTNLNDNSVSVIDTVKGSVALTITGIQLAYGAAVTPDGKSVYVGNAGPNGSVTVISTANNTVSAVIPNVVGPQAPSISPDGAFVYVPSVPPSGAGSVVVISTSSNTIVATIPVGNGPINVAFSPDGSTAYVDNQVDSTISIIDTSTKSVLNTISSGADGTPGWVLDSPDGSSLYVLDLNSIDVISTATNNVTATIPAANVWFGSAVFVAAQPSSKTITQALSPTQLNVFNFGPHAFKNQYPAGTNFSGVNMTVTAQQLTQAQFKALVGSSFPNATCIVYSGQGGNCIDYEVSCSDNSGNPIVCPSVGTPSIDIITSFDTQQSIVNPGFLRRPTGGQFENIFTSFSEQRIDPTVKGRSTGFSDFIAVDLGASNPQGLGNFIFLAPLRSTDPRVFSSGSEIDVSFQLTSVANPSQYVTDAEATLSIVMVADANGNPLIQQIPLRPQPVFRYSKGSNRYHRGLDFEGYLPGTYILTVYGNAFAAQQVQVMIK